MDLASHVSKANEQTVVRWGPPALTGKPNKITTTQTNLSSLLILVSMCDNDVDIRMCDNDLHFEN